MSRRSPLAGASPSQLAALRALVVAYRDWERTAGTPEQTLSPRVPDIGRHLSLPVHVEGELMARTSRRLAARLDAAAIASRREELSGKRQAADVALTLAGIRDELSRIRVLLERSTAHVGSERKDTP